MKYLTKELYEEMQIRGYMEYYTRFGVTKLGKIL